MNIAEYAIKKKVVTWALTLTALIGGIVAYFQLPRLEDPEFTIKKALVVTSYPGASAEEVAEEVTDKIEKAAQQLGQLDKVRSRSTRGSSVVTVEIKDKFGQTTLPQVWDELRRKISDVQSQLPPGAGQSEVIDDFGDVYGLYYAIYGDGYTYAELREAAKFLQKELLRAKDVKKISLWGERTEAIYISMSREKLAALSISPTRIYQLLAAKNLVANAGKAKVGDEFVAIVPSGGITSFEQLGKMLISGDGKRLIHLRDVAEIRRGYVEPPTKILYYQGKPAIGLAISTVLGGNVVAMGQDVA
ncbi:MAG: efflux RND transporter permease subunit, partial [Victivallales bacterium]|nr:efflux RND transporter permease subunit [Victivallales bacterium]